VAVAASLVADFSDIYLKRLDARSAQGPFSDLNEFFVKTDHATSGYSSHKVGADTANPLSFQPSAISKTRMLKAES
jgi:hypothetical protein